MKLTTEQILLNNIHCFKNNYCGIFDMLDNERKANDTSKWPDYVYLPKSNICNTINEKMNNISNIIRLIDKETYYMHTTNIIHACQAASFLYNWRRNKKIYKVSDALTNILCNIADNADRYSIYIPKDKLFKLENNGIFIHARIDKDIYGFYAVFDHDSYGDNIIFYIVGNKCEDDAYTKNIVLPDVSELIFLDGKSIGESIDHTDNIIINANAKSLKSDLYSEEIKNIYMRSDIEGANKIQMRALAILTYILNENSDVIENPSQAKIYRKPDNDYAIKDKFREIQIFDVGFNVANSINNFKKNLFEISRIKDTDKQDNSSTDNDSITKLQSDYENEINRLKKKIEELNTENITLQRNLSSYKAMYKELEDSIEPERRELYDLREIVFNNKNTDCKESDTNFKFPYILKRKTVIIGGTVSWANSMKSKFNNAKVIDGLTMPNTDLIKYANIIWIQVDCMQHKHYYRIINIARSYNIQVRYFSHKGITSCCNQLIKSDIENS